jgi:zinc protease
VRNHSPRAYRRRVPLTIFLALTAWGLAAALGSASSVLATTIAPVRFVASNGITVLVVEQHALPIVQLHALVKSGSAQDPPGKAGLANLVAGLLDEGTATRSPKQIAEEIEFVGGSLAAKAAEDFTTASARILKKDLKLGFELLADILLRPAFPEAELERVRSLTQAEILSEQDDPGMVASKAFNQMVFDSHPYRWPVVGTAESLATISRADVQAFYAREYLPNRTILAIVGDVTVEEARRMVEQYFGTWKPSEAAAFKTGSPAPLAKPVTKIIEKDLTQATIILGHEGISRTNPDFYPVLVMNYILGGGGFSSRLMDEIRDNQGLAYGVVSAFHAHLMPGAFLVSVQTRNEAANQAIAGVLREITRMRETPVSDEELADAKAYLMGSFPLRLDTTAKLAEVVGQVEFYGLGLEYFTQYPRWIEKVTKEDVLRVARQYLHPDRYALVLVGNAAQAKVKQ